MQDLCRVEAEPAIHLQAVIVAGEEIDDQVADADVEHQVWNAFIAVFVNKAIEISA